MKVSDIHGPGGRVIKTGRGEIRICPCPPMLVSLYIEEWPRDGWAQCLVADVRDPMDWLTIVDAINVALAGHEVTR